MARSVWKGPNIVWNLLEKLEKARVERDQNGFAKPMNMSRACTIIPECIGFTFKIHNGKNLIDVEISEDMVGHKFGEFVPTKKPVKHPDLKKEKKK